jgi:hypothetical protein
MNLSLLGQLKHKLKSVEDLGEALSYFFDEFGDDTNFLVLGERYHDEALEAIVLATVRSMSAPEAELDNLLITRLVAENFIHAGFTSLGKLGLFFYFPEDHLGLVSMTDMNTGQTALGRFRNSNAMPYPSKN